MTAVIAMRCVVSACCFIGATALLILGRDQGWGWLIVAGIITCPGMGD